MTDQTREDVQPVIRVVPGELTRTLDEAERALIEAGEDIFVHGTRLVRIVRIEGGIDRSTGVVMPIRVNALWLRERMSRAATWYNSPSKGEPRRIDPPKYLASALLARRGGWKFRPLHDVHRKDPLA